MIALIEMVLPFPGGYKIEGNRQLPPRSLSSLSLKAEIRDRWQA
jgi:hypothetical protein